MSSALYAVPKLDGTLETATETVDTFSKDFGNLITGVPQAVLRPGSVQDIVKMVDYARRHDLKIAMNGQGGTGNDLESHSNYGQAAVPGGISIDAKGLSTIHRIGATTADVDSGVTWAALVDAALAQDKTPAALTDYIHLSIGGTVSVGGIGGTVQKYGLQCDTVEEIEVVTGSGHLVTTSATKQPELFNAVLASGGQCGIIVRARVKLVPAPTRALVMNLFYNDLPTYLADQEKILKDGRFSHQEGEIVQKNDTSVWRYNIEDLASREKVQRERCFGHNGGIVRQPDASDWRYKIEAVTYFSPPTVPDQAALLADLHDDRPSAQIAEQSYRDWIFRLDPFEKFLKDGGFWAQPHPWLSLVLPASKTPAFIRSVVSEITPGDLGMGFSVFYPFKTSKLTRPLFALPSPPEPVAYLFDLLRFPFPNDPGIPSMLDQNRCFYDKAVAVGAKRYLVGAIPGMTQQEWRRHFGHHFNRFTDAKRHFDPGNVLTPGQGFFG
jgi:cytokinin dehydrogenase